MMAGKRGWTQISDATFVFCRVCLCVCGFAPFKVQTMTFTQLALWVVFFFFLRGGGIFCKADHVI